MKTVCKKLLCLMLVAMMLVSAVPFAFAADVVVCEEHNKEVKRNPDYDVIGDCVTPTKEGYYCSEGHKVFVEVPANGHETTETVATAATCTEDGEATVTCANCDYTATKIIPKTGHETTTTVATEATCTEDGEKLTTCKNCDYAVKEVIEATGHNYVGGECTKCEEGRAPYKTITFYYLDSNGDETSEVRTVYASGEEILIPSVPANPNSGFSYWAQYSNGTGASLNASDRALAVNSETPNAFHAIYNKKSAMSELKIYVVRYVNGVRKEANYLYSEHFLTSNDNDMYQYLWENKDDIRTAAIDEIGEGYTWNNKFYNYFTDEELTDANLKDNGNKSVYIKMNTKNSNEAQVQIYVHKSKTSAVHDILDMNGYNAGEWVYLKDVKDFLDDEGYSWSSTSSLYTDEEWDDLMDGESPSGSNGIKITDNGFYKIHIILKGASQSSNADSSNPKTGDSIMVAVTTMTLAAAALVAVVELKKRKMI